MGILDPKIVLLLMNGWSKGVRILNSKKVIEQPKIVLLLMSGLVRECGDP